MFADPSAPRSRLRRRSHLHRWAVCVTVASLALTWSAPVAAQELDARLERAQSQRAKVQGRLDGLLQRLNELEVETERVQAELDDLTVKQQSEQARADTAGKALALQVRESYMRGATDPTLTLVTSATPQEALEQSRILGLLARQSRADYEGAAAAGVQTQAIAEQVESAAVRLTARQGELEAAESEVSQLVAQAAADERSVRETIAAEEEARRAEAERQAREVAQQQAREAAQRQAREVAERETSAQEAAAGPRRVAAQGAVAAAVPQTDGEAEDDQTDSDQSDDAPAPAAAPADSPSEEEEEETDLEEGRGDGDSAPAAPAPSAPAAPSGGGPACPVGQPRTYSDTWGAARSGGRAHKGVDILAPHGTPIYAYESGTISRLNNNGLGGISLYLRGDSGNVYYYTHLAGYVGGVSAGMRVSAGEQIARNGDTGNARGIPHLHFEVQPGGGGSVNPYPYARRACG